MATIGLELVDAAIIAVRDGARAAPSPGVAVIDPAGLLVGEPAAATARLRPLLATDHFWTDLSAEAMVQTASLQVSHADLAHAHLAQLWGTIAQPGDQAVLAIPGTMRLPQIGLALGIARRAGIPVAGVVDAAVAACAELPARASVLHLDVQLHQAVLTVLQGAKVLRRARVEVASRAGLKAMHAAWAQVVSEAMVRRTRFDPLHQSASEQSLYERLPGWLEQLAIRETVDVAIETESNSFSTTLHREQFSLAADAWYAQLVELVQSAHRAGSAATLALSARAAALPGLRARFEALAGLDVTVLADTAPAEAAATRADELGPAEPPALVTALQRRHPAAAGNAAGVARARGSAPTHVVLESRAHRIDDQPLVLGQGEAGVDEGRRLVLSGQPAGVSHNHCTLQRQGGEVILRDHSRYGSFVNDERVDGEAVVAAGDRLRLGTPGVVLELVAVT